MARKKRWRDLSTRQRVVLIVAAVVELVSTATALADLARRPASQVRGPKLAWAIACFIQPFGPAAYLRFGRRRELTNATIATTAH
jgi:hypothetical protein